MKLQELAVSQKTQQVAKVMESYFGQEISFDRLSRAQARNMLNRVRGMIAETRRQPGFHVSEQNPAYLKLLMMEQGLSEVATAAPQTPQQAQALATAQQQQKKKQIQDQMREVDDQIRALQTQKQSLQQQMNSPVSETRLARRLREASEVQQAQVVLASKDIVDQVQKMIEQTTAIQFKDLPALVDQIRNEVGYDQATQFNTDATAALSGLVQNLQAAKTQLDGALGVVTGQSAGVPGVVPGAEMGADLGAEMGADLGAAAGADLGAELPPEDDETEEPSGLERSLGRAKR
jgi:hypothetical protein